MLIMIGIGALVLFAGTGRGSSRSGSNVQFTAQGFAQAYAGGPSGDAPSCPSLMFFGVRGSGEQGSDHGGYGSTIWSLNQDMQGMVHGMQSFAIGYPAIAVPIQQIEEILFGNAFVAIAAAQQLFTYESRYNASVTAGVGQLLADYNAYERACRGGKVMFAGYSQGADVIYQAYKLLPRGQRQHVIMASFGDPHFNSYDTFVDQGNFTRGRLSILPYWWARDVVHTFPYSDGSHVHSWCLHGDGVCNYSFGNMVGGLLPSYPHYHYMDSYTAEAAKWAYDVWKNLA
jgi:hypothetical protein